MRFLHRYGFRVTEAERKGLDAQGATVQVTLMPPSAPTELVVIVVAEDDPAWPAVARVAAEKGRRSLVTTEYTNGELSSAASLTMNGSWISGYPLPDDDNGYLDISYDTTSRCGTCGVGKEQKAPIRIREPRWGNKSIFQLNWVHDEFFVEPGAYERVFAPHGVASREVHDRKGVTLPNVIQLDIPGRVELDEADLTPQVCGVCNRTKFEPVTRGPVGPLRTQPGAAMAKSEQVFGYGASAFRVVMVSAELYRAIAGARLKGVNFEPVLPFEVG